jgi:tripartite-type tricarboxylate transporter receptor subunit TctC
VSTDAVSFAQGNAGTVYFMTEDSSLYQDAHGRIKLLGTFGERRVPGYEALYPTVTESVPVPPSM